MGTRWYDRQINFHFKEMIGSGKWSQAVLQEAARQSWLAFYHRPQGGPDLADLLSAPEPVKIMKRRVAKDTKVR